MDNREKKRLVLNGITLLVLIAFAFFIRFISSETTWQHSGILNFSFAFVLLAAFLSAVFLKHFRLPMLSGYILAGVISGPHVSGFLTREMVSQFQLIDDLALNFIAFSAGAALHINTLKRNKKPILMNIACQSAVIFLLVTLLTVTCGTLFRFTARMETSALIAFSILMGVISIARSPSSAMAIIIETRSKGRFTDTILGVTVAIDVLVIIFFTIALTSVKLIMSGNNEIDIKVFTLLFTEISASIIIGFILGKSISFYIKRIGHDLPLFLLFTAFAVAKAVLVISYYLNLHFQVHLTLEPLLICMSAGFTIQNFSNAGAKFETTLSNMSLPIYILFFSIAGAALDLEALALCWPLALFIVMVRIAGIYSATYISSIISGEPPVYRKASWMAYVTQAGVAIGLAQIVRTHYPEIGNDLTTLVLSVITINQIAGPVTLKVALSMTGEAGAADRSV